MNRMKRCGWITVVMFSLVVLGLTVPAVCQEKIDETRDLNKNGTLKVSNISGSVSVTGWAKNKVEIKGVLGKGTERLVVEGDKDQLEVRVKIPERARNVEETHLELRVPEGCRLTVETVSADITVTKLTGRMKLASVSGDVMGDGGPESVDVETVSGDINLETQSTDVGAETVSGDVDIRMAGGRFKSETVSGDVMVVGKDFESVAITTVSGEIDFQGGMTGDGSYSFESHSGDVQIQLSGAVSAQFIVSTFSGEIDNGFGSNGRRTSEYGPGKELDFTVGSGDAEVDIETFSGDVKIVKK